MILCDTPVLAWGLQTCLTGFPDLRLTVHLPRDMELTPVLAEKRPDLVLVALSQPQPGLCRQLRAAQQRGTVRALVCLYAAGVGCQDRPAHLALPLASATPAEIRRLMARALGDIFPERFGAPAEGRMTAREREIGALVVTGLSSQEIGQRLFISPRTVEKHRANLMEKLHVTNAAALTLELVYELWDRWGGGRDEEQSVAAAPAESGRRVA